MNYKKIIAIVVAVCLVLTATIAILIKTKNSTTNSQSSTATGSATGLVAAGTCSLDTSDLFSERDLTQDYDESEAKTITLSGSDDVKITEEGVYVLTGSFTGTVVVNVEDSEKVELVLNNVEITTKNNACILVENADKVFITLAEGSTNTLKNTGSYQTYDGLSNIDACIFSKEDLTLKGTGTLSIDAIGKGIVSKDDLKVTGGSYTIIADEHAVSGKESILINDGTFSITAGEKGLKSKNKDEQNSGIIYIGGGDFTISAGTEGIEGTSIYIAGGKLDITARDDGINAASEFQQESNLMLEISGGYIHINAQGDGVDSNGAIVVTGGETYISGSTSGGDCAFDYETSGTVTGGLLVAAGMSEMAENFSVADQGTILINSSSTSSKDTVTLTDSDGNTLVSWTPDKTYNSVLITCPEIKQGETYTIACGDTTAEVTMDELIYGDGKGQMGMGGFNFGGGRGGGMKDPGGNQSASEPPTNSSGQLEKADGDSSSVPEMPTGGKGGQTPPSGGGALDTSSSNKA